VRLPQRLGSSRRPGDCEERSPSSGPRSRLRPGEYLASADELFQVESCGEKRAIVQNCMSGDLYDVAIEELLSLRHVEATAP